MTLKAIASRMWLFGWFVAWIVISRRNFSPVAASRAALIFGTSGLLAGIFLFFRGFQLLQRKRWIEDTPVSRISAAALGRVKIFGRATGPYTLISPLAQVDCYYYRAVAREASDERNEKSSESFAEETIFTPLFVEDETGRMLIDPRGAELEIPSEYEEAIETESMSECARRFLRRHGVSTLGNIAVTECAIKPGDPMLVMGTLIEDQSRGTGISGRSPEAPYLSSEAADLQRREQMEAMGIPVGDLQSTNAHPTAGFNLHPEIVLSAGLNQEPFVLSRRNPEHIVGDLARNSVFGIWGGAMLTVLSLGLIIYGLGFW
jgi:hypothetical protein